MGEPVEVAWNGKWRQGHLLNDSHDGFLLVLLDEECIRVTVPSIAVNFI